MHVCKKEKVVIFLYRTLFVLYSIGICCTQKIECQQLKLESSNPSAYLSDEAWEMVEKYVMRDDHPLKEKLDQIFSKSRIIRNQKSMVAAGFDAAEPQKFTRITVTKHSEMPGYIFKIYFDTLGTNQGHPEYNGFVQRVKGSQLIRRSIEFHNYEHLLKVPRKWLYLLPDEPSPSPHHERRFFILVEDDMDIFRKNKNKNLWKSEWVTKELLNALFTITTELCLSDSAVPNNCPFSKDGRVAFIDTQRFNTGMMKYEKLIPYLSPDMKAYWKKLIKREVMPNEINKMTFWGIIRG